VYSAVDPQSRILSSISSKIISIISIVGRHVRPISDSFKFTATIWLYLYCWSLYQLCNYAVQLIHVNLATDKVFWRNVIKERTFHILKNVIHFKSSAITWIFNCEIWKFKYISLIIANLFYSSYRGNIPGNKFYIRLIYIPNSEIHEKNYVKVWRYDRMLSYKKI